MNTTMYVTQGWKINRHSYCESDKVFVIRDTCGIDTCPLIQDVLVLRILWASKDSLLKEEKQDPLK